MIFAIDLRALLRVHRTFLTEKSPQNACFRIFKERPLIPVHCECFAARMFRLVPENGRKLVRQSDPIEARTINLLSDKFAYQLLTTVPRIGPINAGTILAGARDMRR